MKLPLKKKHTKMKRRHWCKTSQNLSQKSHSGCVWLLVMNQIRAPCLIGALISDWFSWMDLWFLNGFSWIVFWFLNGCSWMPVCFLIGCPEWFPDSWLVFLNCFLMSDWVTWNVCLIIFWFQHAWPECGAYFWIKILNFLAVFLLINP